MNGMDGMEQIRAMAWAARQRGTTYGELSATLTPEEIGEICEAYRDRERDGSKRTTGARAGAKNRKRRTRSFDERRALELYRQNMSDGQIAKAVGAETASTIRSWRIRRGLMANYKQGQRPGQTRKPAPH